MPDHRLRLRATLMLAQRARRPGDSIPQASGDLASAKGAYRLLENDRLTAADLWHPIHAFTAKTLEEHAQVLVIQDITTLMFPRLTATTGLGTVDQQTEQALLMMSGLAVTPEGLVLGLIHNHVWARPPELFHQARQRKQRPLEDKQSYEWIRGIDTATEARDRYSSQTRLLFIFDREGDIHDALQAIIEGGHDGIIRHNQNRKVAGPYGHVRETLAAQAVRAHRTIEVPRRQGQRRRRARLAVRSTTVTLTPPRVYPGRHPLTINVVGVQEIGAPDGIEPLQWTLLTTRPVDTVKHCWEVIDLYKHRWLIEDLHLTLKSGCAIEKTQLKTAERIEELLALLCAIAARILALRQWARAEPDVPCTVFLCRDEWVVLLKYTQRQPVPPGRPPPTMREAVRMIGRIGGHLGRKSDGLPGVRSLWKGWRDLQILVEGYRLNRD